MRYLLILALLPSAVWATSICNFKEQTLITNEEDQQVLSKHRVDTCVEKTSEVEYGLSSQCGVPRQIDPYHPAETVACQLDDGSWQQHNVFYSIDQFGRRTELTKFSVPDFTDNSASTLGEMIAAKIKGWRRQLNEEQQFLHYTAIKSSLEQSSNGQGYQWQNNKVMGTVTVVATFQTSQGYCKIIHTSFKTGSQQLADAHRACYNNSTNIWYWVDDKY
jgi:surface antigen